MNIIPKIRIGGLWNKVDKDGKIILIGGLRLNLKSQKPEESPLGFEFVMKHNLKKAKNSGAPDRFLYLRQALFNTDDFCCLKLADLWIRNDEKGKRCFVGRLNKKTQIIISPTIKSQEDYPDYAIHLKQEKGFTASDGLEDLRFSLFGIISHRYDKSLCMGEV